MLDIMNKTLNMKNNNLMNINNTSSRVQYIDILRVIACFLVLLTHSALASDNENVGIWYALYSFIGSPSSELFLAISGSLLLPIKLPSKEFYKIRFSKLLYPKLFWSIFYIIYDFYLNGVT